MMKKIKSITATNANTWYELNTPVTVMTANGPVNCKRFYFNGYHKTKIITFSDESIVECTPNHQLLLNTDMWCRADKLQVGDIMNNGCSIITITTSDIPKPTMDMEVPNVHHYVLKNGIMSHNSSFILGQVSPSIEPLNSNYFVKDLAKGKFTYKNPYLKEVLKKYDKDDKDTWQSILIKGGSVQHLKFLTDNEKAVFKTFGEISQKEIVIQASIRQKYIDQSQSLNLMISPKTMPKDVSQLLIFAWEQGIKTLYYQRAANPSQELARSILSCESCEA
jgi:hypothetical protein